MLGTGPVIDSRCYHRGWAHELRYTLLHILCYTECIFYVNPDSVVIKHHHELKYPLLHILCYTECLFYVNPVSVVIKHHSIIFGDVRFRASYRQSLLSSWMGPWVEVSIAIHIVLHIMHILRYNVRVVIKQHSIIYRYDNIRYKACYRQSLLSAWMSTWIEISIATHIVLQIWYILRYTVRVVIK